MAGAIRVVSRRFLEYTRHPNPSSVSPPPLFSSRGFASKLFVTGVSFSTTESTLAEAFSQFGEVVEAKIIPNKARTRPKGFAYITFATEGQAQKAAVEMNGKLLDGRVVSVVDGRFRISDGIPVRGGDVRFRIS